MDEKKNVFISHVHEDDENLQPLKDLISRAGMEVRDGSINSKKPNEAQSEEYIKNKILAPQINWASTLLVLISRDTAQSWWVNWEIKYAVEQGKHVIGVYERGATDADMPEELRRLGDAAVVGWHGERIIDAINGKIGDWENPNTGKERSPDWAVKRYTC